MIKKIVFTLATLFEIIHVFGQEPVFTEQGKVSDAIAFEKKLNPNAETFSKNIVLSKDYYPLIDQHQVANPIIVQRTALSYLPLSVEYYYSPEDSVIRFVSYEWEKDKYGNYFNKMALWKEESKKFKTYNKEYERIKQNIVTQFGAPVSTDSSAKENAVGNEKYYTRETTWHTESLQIRLWMIFASNTYRIRMSIYWKGN